MNNNEYSDSIKDIKYVKEKFDRIIKLGKSIKELDKIIDEFEPVIEHDDKTIKYIKEE